MIFGVNTEHVFFDIDECVEYFCWVVASIRTAVPLALTIEQMYSVHTYYYHYYEQRSSSISSSVGGKRSQKTQCSGIYPHSCRSTSVIHSSIKY